MNQPGRQNFRVPEEKGTCRQTCKPEVYGFDLPFRAIWIGSLVELELNTKVVRICCEVSTGVGVNSTRA